MGINHSPRTQKSHPRNSSRVRSSVSTILVFPVPGPSCVLRKLTETKNPQPCTANKGGTSLHPLYKKCTVGTRVRWNILNVFLSLTYTLQVKPVPTGIALHHETGWYCILTQIVSLKTFGGSLAPSGDRCIVLNV